MIKPLHALTALLILAALLAPAGTLKPAKTEDAPAGNMTADAAKTTGAADADTIKTKKN